MACALSVKDVLSHDRRVGKQSKQIHLGDPAKVNLIFLPVQPLTCNFDETSMVGVATPSQTFGNVRANAIRSTHQLVAR